MATTSNIVQFGTKCFFSHLLQASELVLGLESAIGHIQHDGLRVWLMDAARQLADPIADQADLTTVLLNGAFLKPSWPCTLFSMPRVDIRALLVLNHLQASCASVAILLSLDGLSTCPLYAHNVSRHRGRLVGASTCNLLLAACRERPSLCCVSCLQSSQPIAWQLWVC